VHLEPLSKPSALWFFHNPRRRQVDAVLAALPRAVGGTVVGTVLGGDFNTVQGGAQEDAYRRARSWSRGLEREDRRSTHDLGRLDFLFVQLSPEWRATTRRSENKYGSDHHPVLARFWMRQSARQ
jgi:endonuclease/exonuclease/phosphatase (EEP) superfamily protein YafD